MTTKANKNYFIKQTVLCCMLATLGVLAHAQTYVTVAGAGTMNGSSWGNAYPASQLQLAINAATAQVWIAAGTYVPTTGTDRTVYFNLPSGISLYGGFAGTETSLGQRNSKTNVTILSGDIGTAGVSSDNSYTILNVSNAQNNIIDGITFSGAYSNSTFGGGIYYRGSSGTSLTVSNCNFSGNTALQGASIYSDGSNSGYVNLTLQNCVFNNNYSYGNGAGIYNNGNHGTATLSITNSVFASNNALFVGAALFNYGAGANTTIFNSTFSRDTGFGSVNGSTIRNQNFSRLTITNSIVWNTPVALSNESTTIWDINYSDMQGGGFDGSGNINADPQFVNSNNPAGADNIFGTADDGLMVGCVSPAKDGGTATGAPSTDIVGTGRPQFTGFDMGAYENTAPSVTLSVTITASQNNICAGIPITFTAVPVNGGSSPLYQWQKNGNNVGGTSNTYTDATLADGDLVTTTITGSEACATAVTAISNHVTMALTPQVTPSVSITASQNNICVGTPVTFTAVPTNGGASPQHQWLKNGSNVGGNTTTYTDAALADNDVVTCVVTSNATCASPVSQPSNPVTMVVNSIATPSVSIKASQNNICSGTLVTFTAEPVNGGSSPSYDWFKNGSSIGVHTNTYIDFFDNDDVITCTVTTSLACITVPTATSSPVTMSVTPSVLPSVYIEASQNNICTGTSVTFTAAPTNGGGVPSYQWFKNGNNVGNDEPTYTDALLADNDVITCTLTSNAACAVTPTANSNSVVIGVIQPGVPAVTIATTQTLLCSGAHVTFTANAVNSGTPAYQWVKNGSNVGTNSATYTDSVLADNDAVSCVITSNAACLVPALYTSNTIKVGVNNYASGVVYVDAAATGSNNGTTWANAFTNLQTAIGAASGCALPVWVKAGTYRPQDYPAGLTSTDNGDYTFDMKAGVSVYGGFAGTETSLAQRNIHTNVTTLSGDIGAVAATNNYNSYHVVLANNLSAPAMLDGFTITLGNGSGSNANGIPQNGGGGVLITGGGSNFTLSNCTVTQNSAGVAGGVYVFADDGEVSSSPAITNCTILNNTATFQGGGAYTSASTAGLSVAPIFTNCVFANNTSVVTSHGGGIYNYSPSGGVNNSSFINCVFTGNNAGGNRGGGMLNYGGDGGNCNVAVTNTTFYANTAGDGGAIYNWDATTTVVNSIFNGNSPNSVNNEDGTLNISYSDLDDGYTGTSDINTVPQFVNTANLPGPDGIWGTSDDGLTVGCASPAIDAGTSTGAPSTDIVGTSRPQGAGIDMGAYENVAYKRVTQTWTGSASGDWANSANWSNGLVPDTSVNITIPAGTPNSPLINTAVSTSDITVNTGALLHVTSNGTINTYGNITNNGVFDASTGTVVLQGGCAQAVSGIVTINNVTVNNPAGVTIAAGSQVNVKGVYTPTAGTLNTNGALWLKSDSAGTASVAQGSGNYINGTVTVERYIPSHRAWRLLTSPLSNSGTIYANWQNNGITTDSTGAVIFAPGGGGGFTAGGHAASIELYDEKANSWVNLTNTDNTLLATSTGSADNNAYALFVTGPYGSNTIGKGAVATRLQATGTLQTGPQEFSHDAPASGNYVLIPNPYASPVDFTNLHRVNVYNTMWAWDAQRSGTSYGGYVTFSWDATTNSYDQDIDPSQTKQTTVIQSGQAFFVQTRSGFSDEGVSVTFNESDKASASTQTGGVFGVGGTNKAQQMRITLNHATGATGDTLTPVDAVLAKFGEGYNKGIGDDATKLYNYDENLSLLIDTNYLSIERRPMPAVGDTLFLNTYALKKNTAYAFTVNMQNMQGAGVQAMLVDKYSGTKTTVSLTGTTTIAFSTGSDAASLLQTRFVVVFGPAGALATILTNVKAWQVNNGVQVGWTAPTELGVKQYEVEKSGDGQYFAAIGTAAAHNTRATEVYDFTDAQPFAGDNYYRVKVLNSDGTVSLSNVVLVKMARGAASFKVYPNPVLRSQQLQAILSNMGAGKYTLLLYDNTGKQVVNKTVVNNGAITTEQVALPAGLAAGSYRLVLLDGNGKVWKQQLMVE